MKVKIFVSIITFIVSQYAFSQDFYSDINDKTKYNVTIHFKDSTQQQYNAVRISSLSTGLKQKYTMMPSFKPLSLKRLKKQKVIIKPNKSKKIEIPNNSIQTLIIENVKNGSTFKFKSLTIKEFDKNLNLVTIAENILLPLRYSDSLNIYGFKLITVDSYTEHKNGFSSQRTMPPTLSGIYYYLNHPDDNVVINPIDFSGGMFNTKLISDKFVATLKEIGKDCDAFVTQYENYNYAKVSKEQSKEFMKTYRKKIKAIKKESKKLPKKEREAFMEREYERIFMLDNFIKIIDNYKSKCGK
ncbi:hypothetical protein [uncultured Kordia sp.]|uniref:hypothetical protein n=1 Tax=uncultured Kordia sp. TaxID=507699 RepID=UPI0026209E34|nr:hypothetical protein [uncultured Kordia sp.]